jgi:hypothetical protein
MVPERDFQTIPYPIPGSNPVGGHLSVLEIVEGYEGLTNLANSRSFTRSKRSGAHSGEGSLTVGEAGS